jgi:hypothetical protein
VGAIADHQAVTILVAFAGELGDVGVHLGLQRLGQHPPGALADDLIDSDDEPSAGRSSPADGSGLGYGEHPIVPSRPARQRRAIA